MVTSTPVAMGCTRDSRRGKAISLAMERSFPAKLRLNFLQTGSSMQRALLAVKALLILLKLLQVIKPNSRDPDKTYSNPFTGDCNLRLHLYTKGKFFISFHCPEKKTTVLFSSDTWTSQEALQRTFRQSISFICHDRFIRGLFLYYHTNVLGHIERLGGVQQKWDVFPWKYTL